VFVARLTKMRQTRLRDGGQVSDVGKKSVNEIVAQGKYILRYGPDRSLTPNR